MKRCAVPVPSADEFFSATNGDVSRVTWAHAVNNRQELEKALNGSSMMIEADILMGTISGDEDVTIRPIMAHPPLKQSDLTLEQFLDSVLSNETPKGLKLDFKDINAVEPAMRMIRDRRHQIKVPVWLNADILEGPVNATQPPLNAARFLRLSRDVLAGSVLSPGWTTRFGPQLPNPLVNIRSGSYSMAHVQAMKQQLTDAGVDQAVTFPVRAGLLASTESKESLIWLLQQIPDSTLTLWSSEYDTVDIDGLMDTLGAVGLRRVYIDVPGGLHCQIFHYDADV